MKQLSSLIILVLALPSVASHAQSAGAECAGQAQPSAETVSRSVDLAAAAGVGVLTSGEIISGLSDDRPRSESLTHYSIEVPEGADLLSVQITGGTGDADLYLNLGAQASTNDYYVGNGVRGRSIRSGNEDRIDVPEPEAGTWYLAVHGWSPYADMSLRAVVEGGDDPPPITRDVLTRPSELPQAIHEMWGDPARREHHQLWHYVSGGGWERLSPQRQRDLAQRGWEPPDHSQEELGLDFIGMHRQMVDLTKQGFAALGIEGQLKGWKLEEFPWGLDPSREINDRWPASERFQNDASARRMREQVNSTFANDEWLRTVSLGEMSRGVERSFHNWMHMRFAGPQPSGDPCATNWLGSTCSSQQNPYFWKLHTLIDELPQRWARANAGQEVELFRGGPKFQVPENFAADHPDSASDEDVYLWTSKLVYEEFDPWVGPMPGPPVINGQQLVMRSFLQDSRGGGMQMDPDLLAQNRANTRAAVAMLNQDGDDLRDFTLNTFSDGTLDVYTMMSAMLSPEEKAKVEVALDDLSTPFVEDVRYGPAILSKPERQMLDLMLNRPEDFQRPSPSMITVIKRAVRKVHDAGVTRSGGALLGEPLPPGIQPEQYESAEQIIEIVKNNPAIMQIPEVREALGLPPN